MKRVTLLIIACLMFVAASLPTNALAQLRGTKNIPGDYTTLGAAITDLNAKGVGAGGVTIRVVSGTAVNVPPGGYRITAKASASSPIVIQGNNTPVSGNLNTMFGTARSENITVTGFVAGRNASPSRKMLKNADAAPRVDAVVPAQSVEDGSRTLKADDPDK